MNANAIMTLNLVIMFFLGISVWLIFMRNFLLSWIKVKLPFTKYNVLVEIKHPVSNYYAPGQIQKSFLYYNGKKTTDNPKASRIVDLTEIEKKVGIGAIVERINGVPTIRVDDAKSCIIYFDGESYQSISGYSSEAIDDLVTDAQNRPSLEDGFVKPRVFQIIVIFGIIIAIVVGVVVYMNVNKQSALIDGHLKMVFDYTIAMANKMNVTATPLSNFTGIGG